MKILNRIILFFCLSIVASASDLQSVVDKYYEAIGGKNELNAVNTWYFEGVSTVKTMNLTGEMKYWYKKPDKIKVLTEYKDNKAVQCFNGDFSWQINTMIGVNEPQKLDESSNTQLKAQRTIILGPLYNYGKEGFEFVYNGEMEKNGEKLHHITMTSDIRKSRIDIFINADNYLPVLTITFANLNNRQVEVINYIKEYKNVDGFMIPHKYESVVDGKPYTTLDISLIKTNIDLKDEIFNMPKISNSK